jgi:hypothetical protein
MFYNENLYRLISLESTTTTSGDKENDKQQGGGGIEQLLFMDSPENERRNNDNDLLNDFMKPLSTTKATTTTASSTGGVSATLQHQCSFCTFRIGKLFSYFTVTNLFTSSSSATIDRNDYNTVKEVDTTNALIDSFLADTNTSTDKNTFSYQWQHTFDASDGLLGNENCFDNLLFISLYSHQSSAINANI